MKYNFSVTFYTVSYLVHLPRETCSSAIAERLRCRVVQLWLKCRYSFPYSNNVAVAVSFTC